MGPVAAVLAWLLGTLALPAWASSVAIVTDLSGKATAEGEAISILSEITTDAPIHLDGGTRMVTIYYSSGDEYTFTGPARIQFRAGEPQVLSGTRAEKHANPLAKGGKDIAIKPVGVVQAGFVMRGARTTARIKLFSPSGTRTLERSPQFRWTDIEPGLKYRFELIDETGKSLYEADVAEASLRLPESLHLRDGVGYTWEVSTRLPDGRRYVGVSDFSIASPDLRSQAEVLRPAATAPVSVRVAFALWLQQMELKDEARSYWRVLAVERPHDERLKTLSAE
jgi:hypothetical protein